MPPKRPAASASSPSKPKGFDFSSPSKFSKKKVENEIEQFLIKNEDTESVRWYARVGNDIAVDMKDQLNAAFANGVGGALIYRVDMSNNGDCVTNAIFTAKATEELAEALAAILPAPKQLGQLWNAHLIPASPTLSIVTANDYVKATGAWMRLKKWLLNANFLGGTELEDGVRWNTTDDFDEEYWVNSLKTLCDAKGFKYTVTEECRSLPNADPSIETTLTELSGTVIHADKRSKHDRRQLIRQLLRSLSRPERKYWLAVLTSRRKQRKRAANDRRTHVLAASQRACDMNSPITMYAMLDWQSMYDCACGECCRDGLANLVSAPYRACIDCWIDVIEPSMWRARND